ncbi:MAG TPA: carbohydrate-binding family 9-like protein [Blastocatellia bacterium]|nr:carbohydrate-binding family 9-like protein [Blastocatellia bacterium]
MNAPEIIAIYQSESIPQGANFNNNFWRQARRLEINYNWRGELVPAELKTVALVVWTDSHLCFGFECGYTELDMDDPAADDFDSGRERYALWERDVCEAFVRSPLEPENQVYKEFEVAPNGQWCDLKIDRTKMLKDWEWQSGMQTAWKTNEAGKIYSVLMTIPFESFDLKPNRGDCWQANIFRIARLNGERQYLALSPTMTRQPNFHVPERFINLRFVG